MGKFRKTSANSSIFIKTFWIFFLVKDLTNRLLLVLFVSLWEHAFFARMRRLKNGRPLSAPSSAYFYDPPLLKKNFGENWNPKAFIKKEFEEFSWKLKVYRPEFVHFVHLFSRIWMKLCESQFIWLTIWVCSLCSPCSLVHKDFNEAFWISIHLAKYLSLFTLFTLFTCSWWFEYSFLHLNSFG